MLLPRVLPFLLLFHPAAAEVLALTPPAATVELRFYSFGLFPIDGKYTRFHGELTYDPHHPGRCQAALTIASDSLVTANHAITRMVTGPEFMDATRYPTLQYTGVCNGSMLDGELTMHGVTHAFALSIDREPRRAVAEGRLRRADWGMTAQPMLGGSTVRIRVSLPLPSGAQPARGATP
jgi:polyisoprenoid-binding protein YceI